VDLKKVTMGKNQSSGFYGGGIYAWGSDTYIDIEDVKINKNMARRGGGGIYCGINGAGKIRLANVTVSYNRVEYEEGGGIYCESASNIYFSVDSPSRIYLNKAHTYGADMALWFQGNVEAVLDTFTVSEPSEYHLYPRNNFKLTILHPLFKSIDSDLYVSPTGSDSNLGISPHEPLRSLNAALAFASTDSSHQRYIYMAEGTYSPALTDEDLPLYVRSNITILGSNADNTIIDGDDKSQIISIQKAENICLKNITVQNGYDSGVSGGILASTSGNIIFEDLIIRNNRGGFRGSALAISGGLKRDYLIKNILVYANSMFYDEKGGIAGAGLLLSNVNAKLINITIADNKVENSQDVPGGILIENKSNVSLVNSIVYNNSNHAISCQQSFSGSPTLIVTNSNVEGGETGINKDSLTVIHWLEENIDENPLFVGGEPFDYHLNPSSPCIDAGTPFFEFEGDTIVDYSPEEYNGLAPDMGAFGINLVDFVVKNELIPNQFQLYKNYPNPFNNTTTISYRLAKPGHVILSIYDIMGQLVQVLEDGKRLANTYRFIWNASRYASGIYFVRLSTDNHTAVRKMLLVK
jgi:hypothetical protein